MSNHRKVAIFWDYENCSPPLHSQGHAIVNGIRRIAHVFGYVTSFKAYLDISSQSPKSVGFRSDLQSSGVSMTDCPHNGRKDVVDKMILVDMLAFANDHPSPATVILIAGDRDYAYAVSTLRLRQYNVVLIVPPAPNIPQSLESQASVVVDWNFAILGKRTEADTSPIRQPYLQDLNEDPVVTLISSSLPTPPAHIQRDNIVTEKQQPPVNMDLGHTVQPDALGYNNGDNSSTDDLANGLISSPLLTQVDDPSHAQVANHTTGDTSIVNSALVNDSPPTPEPRVIPISPTSSSTLSPSIPSTPSSLTTSSSSDSVTMKVEIESQQATPVVSDNKDESSECRTLPIGSESIEDKIRRLTPPNFLPLINQLLLARSKGILNPSRSDIANDLIRVDKDVYKRARATKFADYALLAKEASVIEFGGGTTRSNSWITLHTRFRQELDAPKSSTPSIDHSNNPPTSHNDTRTKTSSAAPTLPSKPLITCLSKVHRSGLAKPFPSTVGLMIGPEIYSQAGASSLTEYFSQAVDADVVQCGGDSGHAWISLHPDVLSGKRSC
ncbi:NYN domain-containing protein [Suillus occidentalis]|nr:NYN domain-containing protein [Suillus occidentalis]